MDENTSPSSDDMIAERDVLIGACIVAMALMVFVVGYWGGRDIGSMLFS